MAEYTARRVKRLFSSTRVWTVFGISAFSNILVAISDDSGSMLPRQGLNLLHRAHTMRTKSPFLEDVCLELLYQEVSTV